MYLFYLFIIFCSIYFPILCIYLMHFRAALRVTAYWLRLTGYAFYYLFDLLYLRAALRVTAYG